MPPSRTSSVASSHRRYEGDVESSDDLHEADSPVNERPQTHANRSTRKHELGDVTPRPPLRGFASSEKVLPAPAAPLPSHNSAPSVLPTAASSVPAVLVAPSEPTPSVVVAAPDPAVPAPRIGTSPAPRPLVPFHAESSLWPYPRAPLDDRDDIVELDFADTSALSDVDAFERRRRQNGKNGAKQSKKDIERSWDVPGDITPNVSAGSPRAILGRPSQAPTHNNNNIVVPANGLAASPTPRSDALRANQPNATSAPAKTPEQTVGGPAPAPGGGSGRSKGKAKPPNTNGSNAKVPVPVTVPVPDTKQANGATLARAAASAAIVDAIHAHSNGSAPPPTTDRNEFVREVLTLIHTDPSFVDRLWTEYCARA
ncbi:hypothetical protein BC826DRAFT_658658 [Russula brevipes]|nr:hypothetical protein BC826DRAFT_658658 [Russula brevipes]